jgi:hypothetical protein
VGADALTAVTVGGAEVTGLLAVGVVAVQTAAASAIAGAAFEVGVGLGSVIGGVASCSH